MVISRHYVPSDTTHANVLKEFLVGSLNDISSRLTFNGSPVLSYSSYNSDANYAQDQTSAPGMSWVSTRIYYEFAGDFAFMNCGLMVYYSLDKYCIFPVRSEYDGETITDTPTSISYAIAFPSTHTYSRGALYLMNMPYYIYNGDTVSYFGYGHIAHAVVFAKLKSIDDPNVTKNVVLFNTHGVNGSDEHLGFYSSLLILDNTSLVTSVYESSFENTQIDSCNKIRIEKFIHNGFYSDELVRFEGICPGGLFILDNTIYLHVGYNVYIKVTR